ALPGHAPLRRRVARARAGRCAAALQPAGRLLVRLLPVAVPDPAVDHAAAARDVPARAAAAVAARRPRAGGGVVARGRGTGTRAQGSAGWRAGSRGPVTPA